MELVPCGLTGWPWLAAKIVVNMLMGDDGHQGGDF